MIKKIRRLVRLWCKDEEAATAVEFALVSFPFVYLLIGIIELSVMFAAMSTLDAATNNAARLIRTGQVQTSNNPEQVFADELCAKAGIFLNCNDIQYEVIRMNGFSDFASYPASYDENGDLISDGFDAGAVDDVILIRTVYHYPLLTPLFASAFSDSSHNRKLMVTTVVLETEPYDVQQVLDQL